MFWEDRVHGKTEDLLTRGPGATPERHRAACTWTRLPVPFDISTRSVLLFNLLWLHLAVFPSLRIPRLETGLQRLNSFGTFQDSDRFRDALVKRAMVSQCSIPPAVHGVASCVSRPGAENSSQRSVSALIILGTPSAPRPRNG